MIIIAQNLLTDKNKKQAIFAQRCSVTKLYTECFNKTKKCISFMMVIFVEALQYEH